MKSNNIGYYRILLIDREISRNTYPSSKILAEKCEVSIPTIKRDINTLKLFFHAPIEYSKKRNGYYYLQKTFRLPGILESSENIKIATSVCNFLETIKGSPYYNDSIMFFKELATIAPQFDIAGNREYERENLGEKPNTKNNKGLSKNIGSQILFLGSPHTIIEDKVWYAIIKAIEKTQIISFDYKGYNDEIHFNRIVEPYQLIFDDGEWSLFCYSPKRKETRLFNLSKIKNIKILNKNFILKDDCDFRKQTEGIFGRYVEKEYYNFEILLKGYSAEYSKNRIFSLNQEILYKENGQIIIKFKSNQYSPIKSWLLKQGSNGIPIKPERLVNDWKKEIKEMLKNI
ncbi:MAG: WYL domain-containing protein [Bacteroidales bacterium]|nr:WYL domain-containing protein [Bacteroidales bacterium]